MMHESWKSQYMRRMAQIRQRTRRDCVLEILLQIDRHASFAELDITRVGTRNLNGGCL